MWDDYGSGDDNGSGEIDGCGVSGDTSGSDMWGVTQQDGGNQDTLCGYCDYPCEPQESITDSIFGVPTDESNAGGPPIQEIYAYGRNLTINLDGTVTTYDGQIVCTVDSSEVGTIMPDDVRLLIGLQKIK